MQQVLEGLKLELRCLPWHCQAPLLHCKPLYHLPVLGWISNEPHACIVIKLTELPLHLHGKSLVKQCSLALHAISSSHSRPIILVTKSLCGLWPSGVFRAVPHHHHWQVAAARRPQKTRWLQGPNWLSHLTVLSLLIMFITWSQQLRRLEPYLHLTGADKLRSTTGNFPNMVALTPQLHLMCTYCLLYRASQSIQGMLWEQQ